MTKYVIQRQFSVGEEMMPEIGVRSRRLIIDQFPEVTWIHSHVSVDDTGKVKMFCLYEAPDEAAIHRHAEALGYHIVEAVFEVAGDVTPEDFPLTEEPV